jgi:hypothetical protein
LQINTELLTGEKSGLCSEITLQIKKSCELAAGEAG